MAKTKKSESLTAALSSELRSNFDLTKFKEKKMLNSNVKFKDQRWIPLSPAFQDVTSVPGIPMGHIVLLRGHSDTGKTTAMIEAAVSAQKMKVLPVFIITEMKWNWEHATQMGLQVKEIADEETGLIGLISMLLPIIAGGNTCVILASEKKALTAITLAELIHSSDVPGGVVNLLTGNLEELGDTFSTHMDINALCLSRESTMKKVLAENCISNVKRFSLFVEDFRKMEITFF